jgi:DNA adenine methylase
MSFSLWLKKRDKATLNIPMTPSFRYMGGKSRLRKWLMNYFPKQGNKYLEPFAGVGNVFFQAKTLLHFKEWHLNDLNNFLSSLITANLEELPDKVTRNDFHQWKTSPSPIAKIIEPRITFAGKGYGSGFNAGHKTHTPYDGKRYKATCEQARALLTNVTITHKNWYELEYNTLTNNDFVYFDPPYYETKSSYPNISHPHLLDVLNNAHFRWALSGYDNILYQTKLKFVNRYEKERNSEIKSSNTGQYSAVREVLWTNY